MLSEILRINGLGNGLGDSLAFWSLVLAVISAVVAFLAFIFPVFFWRIGNTREDLTSVGGYARLRQILENDRKGAFYSYTHRLQSLLDKINHHAGAPFSARSFLWLLPFEFVYPIAFAILAWGMSGINGTGIEGFFPDGSSGWDRGLFLLAICGMTYGWGKFDKASGRQSWIWFVIAVAVAVAVAFAGAGAVAVAFAGAVAGAVAVAVAVVGAVAGAVAGAFASAFAVAFAVAFYLLTEKLLIHKPKLLLLTYATLFVVAFIFAFLGAGYLPKWRPEVSGAILIFFIVLVGANALFDWLSLAVTRVLLQKSLSDPSLGSTLAYSLLDLILAFLLLLGLSVAIPLLLELFNQLSFLGASHAGKVAIRPAVNVMEVLQGLEKDPLDVKFLWVYGMLFSTLIPSVINISYAATAWLCAKESLSARPLQLMQKDFTTAQQAFVHDPKNLRSIAGYFASREVWMICFAILSLVAFTNIFFLVIPTLSQFMLGLAIHTDQWVIGLFHG